MQTPNFTSLIAHYHERTFKQWLIVTTCVSILLFSTLIYTTARLIHTYVAIKNECAEQDNEVEGLNQSWNANRSLVKKNKLLKKQLSAFTTLACSSFLKSISLAIPDKIFLNQLTIEQEHIAMTGATPDLHDLAIFTTNLGKQGFKEIIIKETAPAPAQGFYFALEIGFKR